MEILHAVIHRLIKGTQFNLGREKASAVDLKFSSKEHSLEDDSQLVYLASLLENRIKTSGKGSSKFGDPRKDTSTTGHFKKYLDDTESFLEFTKSISNILKQKIPETASGGYLTFIEYIVGNDRKIFICILKLEEGVTIDVNSMEVTDATTIESKNIHEGSRINLNRFSAHINNPEAEESYIDWIKTKTTEKLSSYFQELLEIDIEIDDKKQTTLFKKAVDNYIDTVIKEHSKDVEITEAIRLSRAEIKHDLTTKVYELINTKASNSSSIDFNDVDSLVNVNLANYEIEPEQNFTTFASEIYPKLSNLFKPFATYTKKWGTIKGIVKNQYDHSIKFFVDRSIANNKEYFEYDSESREITIKKVAKEFFEQIN